MEGEAVHELEVSSAASAVWDIYGSAKYNKLVCELLPHVLEKIEVVEGDGGAGSILNIVLRQGSPAFSFKEKMTKLDNEKRVKESELVSGGFLDIGFSLYRVRFEIIEKEEHSCIIKSTIEYKVDTPAIASNVSLQSQNLAFVAAAIGKLLSENKS